MLLLGAAAWAVRCLLFAIGSDRSLVAIYARILMHGVVYGCIYVAGQLMVHDRAPSQMQFAAQGFMALATMGIGNLAEAWIAGGTVATCTSSAARHDWRAIWLVAAAVSSVATIGILLCWRISE